MVTMNNKTKNSFSKYNLLFVLFILLIVFSIASGTFFTMQNLSNMLLTQVVVGMMALGVLFVLIVGEFDLSLGYVLMFSMMVGAIVSQKGVNSFVVIVSMLLAGIIPGIINGWLTIRYGISSFITTLAMGIALKGVTIAISNGSIISGNIAPVVTALGQDKLWGLGLCVWVFVVFCILIHLVLEYTAFGRHLYAVGGSEKISFMSGIKTKKIRFLSFVIAGLMTSIAAVFQLGQTGAGLPTFGSELLMPAYAVVFFGSTTYKPGFNNLPGAVVALLIMGVGTNGLNHIGAPFWTSQLFNGIILLASALIASRKIRMLKGKGA